MKLEKSLLCLGSNIVITAIVLIFLFQNLSNLNSARNPFIRSLTFVSSAICNRDEKLFVEAIEVIIERLESEKGWGSKNAYGRGRVLGLFETASVLQRIATEKGISLTDIGFDINLENLMDSLS